MWYSLVQIQKSSLRMSENYFQSINSLQQYALQTVSYMSIMCIVHSGSNL